MTKKGKAPQANPAPVPKAAVYKTPVPPPPSAPPPQMPVLVQPTIDAVVAVPVPVDSRQHVWSGAGPAPVVCPGCGLGFASTLAGKVTCHGCGGPFVV